MPVSPSSSAQAARQAVADRLRVIRQDAHLKAVDLASAAGWHHSKVSRIEHGARAASAEDIAIWCRVCEAVDQVEDLVDASRTASSMYVEWRRIHRTGMRAVQEAGIALYRRTGLMRVYCSNVVPGLFQTDDYARALMTAITGFQGTPDDVEAAVAARRERSQVIHQAGHRFSVVIEEAVLRHQIGSAGLMTAQLAHLESLMALPAVSLGVIPFTAPERSIWPLPTFTVFDEELVRVELLSARVSVSVRSEAVLYVKAHARLAELAVHGAAARTLIATAINALH